MNNEFDAETHWKNELAKLQREYQRLAQPILDVGLIAPEYLPEEYKAKILAMPKKERDKYLQGEFEPEISDTDRLEHLAEHGFSIWQIIDNGVESWRCQYKIDEQHEGKTLREAMDKAIIAYRKES